MRAMEQEPSEEPSQSSAGLLPLRAFAGETPEATAALRSSYYLDEVDRQAAIFNASFGDAMNAAFADDTENCWRHLQSSLFAAIVVNRLIDPRPNQRGWAQTSTANARTIAMARGRRLRQLLWLPDPSDQSTPLYMVSKVRDSMEHIDERLDRVLNEEADMSVSDWYISDGRLIVRLPGIGDADPTPAGMRAFVPRIGRLYFNAQALDMFGLDRDMVTLRHHVIEAKAELHHQMKGRFTFGGSSLVEIPGMPQGLEVVEAWRTERRKRISELPLERRRLLAGG
jgi:hypothetical protein